MTWTQIGANINGEALDDRSGYSVSLSSDGKIVAIGAPRNDGSGLDAGSVRVYKYDGMSWTQVGMDIDGEDQYDDSGFSVSLSSDGTIVAIGSRYNSIVNSNFTFQGHVRVYKYDGMSWTQVGLDIDGEADDDKSGWSVSLSSDGTIVAIGARDNNGTGQHSGHVRVYEYGGSSWVKLGDDINGEATNDESGISVSLSSDGTIVAIGAHRNDGNGTDSGHVRVYKYDGMSWAQVGIDIDGEAEGDTSGGSVSLSSDGTIVAIGAMRNDGNGTESGHVRVYKFSSGSWIQVGSDIDEAAAGDRSGFSVSLSSDGTRVAIGAEYNSNGNIQQSGHVRVYEYSSSGWTKVGIDIDGEAAGDNSGWSVSLSSDGKIVAIGAPSNDGNGSSSGRVRIFGNSVAPVSTSSGGMYFLNKLIEKKICDQFWIWNESNKHSNIKSNDMMIQANNPHPKLIYIKRYNIITSPYLVVWYNNIPRYALELIFLGVATWIDSASDNVIITVQERYGDPRYQYVVVNGFRIAKVKYSLLKTLQKCIDSAR